MDQEELVENKENPLQTRGESSPLYKDHEAHDAQEENIVCSCMASAWTSLIAVLQIQNPRSRARSPARAQPQNRENLARPQSDSERIKTLELRLARVEANLAWVMQCHRTHQYQPLPPGVSIASLVKALIAPY